VQLDCSTSPNKFSFDFIVPFKRGSKMDLFQISQTSTKIASTRYKFHSHRLHNNTSFNNVGCKSKDRIKLLTIRSTFIRKKVKHGIFELSILSCSPF
jgi:hypothetical protein